MEEILKVIDNGLLILVIVATSMLCSLILYFTNKKKSALIWLMKWVLVLAIYPHKYIKMEYLEIIPFSSPINSLIPILFTTFVFLFYDLITGTKRGKKVSKKFRIIPKLIPMEDDETKEKVDGTSRQITKEIIENEHEILEELVGNLSSTRLDIIDENDAEKLEKKEETIPLANQNFPEIGGEIEAAEGNQEYCESCKKPVKSEWKACPFCGDFLEN